MVLKMKNFNILGVSLENLTFKQGFTKNQYRGGRLPKKGGLGCLLIYRGLRGGGVFEGRVETPMHTVCI